MSDTAFILLALVAGAFLAGQGLINGQLNAAFGSPLLATLISFGVGFACLLLVNFVLVGARYTPYPSLDMGMGLPWWAWTGGILGACIVASAAAAVPRLGAATYFSAVIGGQLAGAAILDHTGAFGYEPRQISVVKIAGLACMGLGVFLIRKG